ncbi:hypothetical protein THRCLA_21690 [Thraustotheca clavata]|uniref:Uncharacterized protein n=1 Tax=Thraustotheca clavata TaxID=74557 RepID=A0A1V9ZRH6_9STRA|nr:hypothetical protein THRCLA_21690 [Thraustotheca clavata]
MKVTWSSTEVICVDEELCKLEDVSQINYQQIEHLNISVRVFILPCPLIATGLKVLNIMHNYVESLTGVEKLVQLRTLKCGHNKIQNLHGIFDNLVHLEELWLNSNRIELAELSSLRPLAHLQTLILEPNPCCKEPMIK